ncbi:MAG: hypothetical protein IH892_23110, partial [Planctomycetes bacterium]|nr:hypothetical protein [Planctomycetota bacterium]
QICARDRRRLTEAVAYGRRACAADPENVDFLCGLAGNLMRSGPVEEGMALFRKAADLAPDDVTVGGMCLWNQHYLPGEDPEAIFQSYCHLAQFHAPASMSRTSYANDRDPERRIRVGFISPDFRDHSVGRSFEPFLDGINHDRLEAFGYGYVKDPDAVTARFREKFDRYRAVRSLSFHDIADRVEQDRIDSLVTHGGHSEDNCLAVLAHKPAPIQVDYGGIDTNGMSQIAYRLTDEVLDPPHLPRRYTEESVYLRGGLASLRPPIHSPLVGPLPAQSNGYLTFGSFNNNVKINAMVLDMWAGVLGACDQSCLILKFPAGSDAGVCDYYLHQLAKRGVSQERVTIYGLLSDYAHLALYNQIDLVLDTYPYNGCITLQEGLWMGVPPVTLVGEPYVSRVGLTVLTRVGLEHYAAADPAEYVAKALQSGQDLDTLAALRGSLRERLITSPLCDPTRLARDLEQAFRMMWRRWCRESVSP